jgi:hypothetical protein
MVTIDLNPAQQTEVKVGDHVAITLPDGQTNPGVVSSAGKVDTVPSSGSSSGSGSSDGSGSTPAITVEVSLSDPKGAAGPVQAPIEVAIITGSVSRALVVPVDALLAQPGRGYAVEATGPGAIIWCRCR